MARWTGKQHTRAVLSAALDWRDKCLQNSGSLFGDEQLWTATNLGAFRAAFVDNPLHGDRRFVDKLAEQLGDSAPPIKRLAAEALWVLYLFVSSDQTKESTKRTRVQTIWELGGTPLPDSTLLGDPALEGMAKTGPYYAVSIPNELEYLIGLTLAWKALEDNRQAELAADAWAFCGWLDGLEGSETRAFRHMLLYLLFPDEFERICSRNHKHQLLEKFSNYRSDVRAHDLTGCEMDREIHAVRTALERELGTTEFDFYLPPLWDRWLAEDKLAGPPEDDVESSSRRFWIEKTIVAGRPDRENGDHALGKALWSPQASTSGADIYSNMRRVGPGDVVFHLTDNSAISGVSIVEESVDDTFDGIEGTDWWNSGQGSYRIALRDFQNLEPPLDRADFLQKEPYASELKALVESGTKGLFYNSKLELNQGAYLTEPPEDVLKILDRAYRQVAGMGLPHLGFSADEQTGAQPTATPRFEPDKLKADLFLDDEEIEEVLGLWRRKKNVILQGPPGVGKSFAARRLANLLMQSTAKERLGFVQFHQSYSYEDFVEGFRPSKDGFELRTGKFVNFCSQAAEDPNNRHVFIIDEINRGNLSRILGELMLLIEPDKRSEKWAMPLAYGNEPFHVPGNVFLLGLMNTADRSLSVVDYALRRRFAFVELEPKIEGEKFAAHLQSEGVSKSTIDLVRTRISELNSAIAMDTQSLGKGFVIGHSFFCQGPAQDEDEGDWYARIIRTEIIPLLAEYWFDAPARADEWAGKLLADS